MTPCLQYRFLGDVRSRLMHNITKIGAWLTLNHSLKATAVSMISTPASIACLCVNKPQCRISWLWRWISASAAAFNSTKSIQWQLCKVLISHILIFNHLIWNLHVHNSLASCIISKSINVWSARIKMYFTVTNIAFWFCPLLMPSI